MANDIIPFLDLVTPHRELEEELISAARQAIRSAAFIGGTEVESFERNSRRTAARSTVLASPIAPTRCDSR